MSAGTCGLSYRFVVPPMTRDLGYLADTVLAGLATLWVGHPSTPYR